MVASSSSRAGALGFLFSAVFVLLSPGIPGADAAFHAVLSGGGRAIATAGAARALLQIPQLPGEVTLQDSLPGLPVTMAADESPGLNSGDAAWMMTSTALVLMMAIPGLSLFYGGLVRPKNVLNVVSNVFGTVALVSIVWVLYGYSIAFSGVNMTAGQYNLNSFFGSLHNGGLSDISIFSSTGNYPASVFITFHMMFAAITTALITGAFAERMKVTAVWAFAVGWSTIVYCPLAHQVWGGDGAFLHSLGAIDFAGGIVVHISSGVSGLAAALIIGKRIGYPCIPKAPHSLVLTHIGGALLWVGWFGFNAGSATAADFVAGQAMLVTQIASASGVIGWTAIERACYRRPSSLGMISGAIAGLVGITPASGSVGAMGAICIGFVTGVLCFCFCTYVKEAIGTYDDSLDVFGIHGIGGIVGAILTAVWCAPKLGGNGFGTIVLSGGEEHPIQEIGTQIGVQLASICYAIVWNVACTFILLKFIDVCHGGFNWRLTGLKHIRCSPKEEEMGLDDAYFAEQGYNFVVEDLNISVEVGPLRGRKGHGLQLYYTDDEGTRHPINFDQADDAGAEEQLEAAARIQASAVHHALSTSASLPATQHENIASALYADGGVVNMKRRSNDGRIVADRVSLSSTPGNSQHGGSTGSTGTPNAEARVYGAGSTSEVKSDAKGSPTSTLKPPPSPSSA